MLRRFLECAGSKIPQHSCGINPNSHLVLPTASNRGFKNLQARLQSFVLRPLTLNLVRGFRALVLERNPSGVWFSSNRILLFIHDLFMPLLILLSVQAHI
jgi:hypothetical protein